MINFKTKHFYNELLAIAFTDPLKTMAINYHAKGLRFEDVQRIFDSNPKKIRCVPDSIKLKFLNYMRDIENGIIKYWSEV